MKMKQKCILLLLISICLTGCGKGNEESALNMKDIATIWSMNLDKAKGDSEVLFSLLSESELGIKSNETLSIKGILVRSWGENIEIAAENRPYAGQIGKVLICQVKNKQHVLLPDGIQVIVTGQFDSSGDCVLKDCEVTLDPNINTEYQPNIEGIPDDSRTVAVQGEISKLKNVNYTDEVAEKIDLPYAIDMSNAVVEGTLTYERNSIKFWSNSSDGLEVGKKVGMKGKIYNVNGTKTLAIETNYYIFKETK